MLRAERRRRGDLVAAAGLVLLLGLGAALVALFSPAAHTTSTPVTEPVPDAPSAPSSVPATFTEAWRAPSAATGPPLAVGPVVVTGDGGAVVGREPLTGRQLWSYQRNLPLCTVGASWNLVLAVYRNGSYCSEVTALNPETGARGPQRNADVRPDTRLLGDGTHLTATGVDHLETWRSDLVRTQEYGVARSPAQPDTQPRQDCLHPSVAVTEGRVGVIERCPRETGDRLTVLRPSGPESDSDPPSVELTTVLPATGARLVAVSGGEQAREAVLLPNPTRLAVRGKDAAGNNVELAAYPLDLPPGDLAGDPPGGVVPTAEIPGTVLWWTGSRTVALDSQELRPLWTVPDTLGPGTWLAGEPVLPVPNAEAVVNGRTGRVLRTVPVDRGDHRGPVLTAALGPVLLEQRGPLLVALR